MSNLFYFWLGKKYGEIPPEKRNRLFFDSLSPFLYLAVLLVLTGIMVKYFSLLVIFLSVLLAIAMLTAFWKNPRKDKRK